MLTYETLVRLVGERTELAKEVSVLQAASGNNGKEGGEGDKLTAASSNAMVEVAEYKAKLRKLRQQVEEKTEQLSETREELEKVQAVSSRLKTENLELCQDARAAKTYRDELDVLRERAEKVDKLEAELLRYKDKMNDIEFFKSRVEELREDNRILVETKEMLEEQLAGSRKRCEAVLGLENDLIRVQGDLERLQHGREVGHQFLKYFCCLLHFCSRFYIFGKLKAHVLCTEQWCANFKVHKAWYMSENVQKIGF